MRELILAFALAAVVVLFTLRMLRVKKVIVYEYQKALKYT